MYDYSEDRGRHSPQATDRLRKGHRVRRRCQEPLDRYHPSGAKRVDLLGHVGHCATYRGRPRCGASESAQAVLLARMSAPLKPARRRHDPCDGRSSDKDGYSSNCALMIQFPLHCHSTGCGRRRKHCDPDARAQGRVQRVVRAGRDKEPPLGEV
jgi:hypothetical protein